MKLRAVVVALAIGCGPPPEPVEPHEDTQVVEVAPPKEPDPPAQQPAEYPITDPGNFGRVVDKRVEFQFEGGAIDFELRQEHGRVIQVARNHYVVPVMVHYAITNTRNLEASNALEGSTLLPPAPHPKGDGAAVQIAEFHMLDLHKNYRRELALRFRFGDPRVQPQPYAYAIPYPKGQNYTVLQGFHGKFSHIGSNEYAVDFQCPVATPVLAAREGTVVAANASAQGSGTTTEYLDYKRVNFVYVRHDDGTLGEYMHLSPSGVEVKPGQRVVRGQELALSGNTGYSSTPHLHFQLMTAAEDGIAAHPFPWVIAAGPGRSEEPVQGRSYLAWE